MNQSMFSDPPFSEPPICDPQGRAGPFALARDTDPYAALGRAAMLLMAHDSFGTLPFRQVTALLAGQVNRGHYLFVSRNGQQTGFVGWAFCSEAAGEAWITTHDTRLIGDGRGGACVAFNSWLTDGQDMNSFLVGQLRELFRDKSLLVARRRYADGRSRPVRLRNARLS